MARRKLNSRRFFHRPAGGFQRTTKRCGRLSLQLEQLEPRLLMAGDAKPAPPAAISDSSAIVSGPVTVNSIPFLSPTTFPLRAVFLPLGGLVDIPGSPYFPETERANHGIIEPPDTMFSSAEEAREWLAQLADSYFGELFAATYTEENWRNYDSRYWDVVMDWDAIAIPVVTAFSAIDAASSNPRSGSFSETNVQVDGVDEADLVESDGRYLYLISGSELVIVDASDAENLSITSRIRLDNAPTGMYLSGDRLTLVSSDDSAPGLVSAIVLSASMDLHNHDTRMPTTTVTVLDLSDRTEPGLVQKTEVDGRLVSSRMVDGQLRLVLNHHRSSLPRVLPGPRSRLVERADSGLATYVYETRDEYLARMDLELIGPLFPGYRSFSFDPAVISENLLLLTPELLDPESSTHTSRTTIATFDVLGDEAGPADTVTFSSAHATTVYATRENLYLFGKRSNDQAETTIWKFDFDETDHSIHRIATGSVRGTLLNQFAADEHDGILRVVTTTNSRDRAGQSLLVLEQAGRQLKVVGSVDGLAPGERLHSVRFLGNRAFVVTFQKVDPLFTIDLSDPTNPTVAGELKIPGYSDYLQPISESHLLGIGRGADAQAGLFQELQVSIFDVSYLDDPRLAHRYSFAGGRSTTSIATGGRWTQGDGDHHAVSYFPSAQILAIPIASADRGGGFMAGVDNTPIFEAGEGGLQLFSVDLETGFEPLATIEHDSPILRALRIGDTLLAYSADWISSHDIANPADPLDRLPLLVGSDAGLVELKPFKMLASTTDYQTLSYQVLTQFGPSAGGLSVVAEGLEPVQPLAAEASRSVISIHSFDLPVHGIESSDAFFSAAGSASAQESAQALDDELLGELVRDPMESGT